MLICFYGNYFHLLVIIKPWVVSMATIGGAVPLNLHPGRIIYVLPYDIQNQFIFCCIIYVFKLSTITIPPLFFDLLLLVVKSIITTLEVLHIFVLMLVLLTPNNLLYCFKVQKIWNSLPNSTTSILTMQFFKTRVFDFLLHMDNNISYCPLLSVP